MGRTVNGIKINKTFVTVFERTNDVANWTSLFSEYESTEVLEQKENYIKFRLTKKPDHDGNKKSWVSERFLDKGNKIIHARRLDPLYPFRFMNLTWLYEDLGDSTKMVWIQEFEVDSQCPFNEQQMEDYLNNASKEEMKSVKNSIECE